MKRAVVGLVMVAVGLAVWAAPAAADSTKLSGTFLLQDGSFGQKGAPCSGAGGYDDIQAGAQVRVRNGDGKTVGVGELGSGHNVSAGTSQYPTFMYCQFRFSVKIPADEDFYSVEVSHRGEVTYPRKKLERAHWKVSLSVG